MRFPESGQRCLPISKTPFALTKRDVDLRLRAIDQRHQRVALGHDPEVGLALMEVRDQVVRRDRDDSTVSTFTEAAEGVVLVDTSDLDFDESVEAVLDVVAAACDGANATSRACGSCSTTSLTAPSKSS